MGQQVDGLVDAVSNQRGRWLLPEMEARGFQLLNGTCPEVNGHLTFKCSRGGSTPDLVFLSADLYAAAQHQSVDDGQLM